MESDNNEIVKQNSDDKLLSKNDVLNLVIKIQNQIQEEREKALEVFDNLTKKDFDKLHEITMKGETAARFLEIAKDSTGELNKLLSTIQKFHSDKVNSDNVDKMVGTDTNNVLDLLDKLNVGADRLIKKPIKTPTVEEVEKEIIRTRPNDIDVQDSVIYTEEIEELEDE